jgi:NAD(P)-dependent dehydrogenase (short-subunit alcohol dehydrogenase family)
MSKPVVVVTGSGRRLGRQILLAFHRHGGFDLVLNYHSSGTEAMNTADLIKSEGGRIISVQADVSKRKDVKRMMGIIENEYGRLDILVNNAAIFTRYKWDTIDDNAWNNIIDTNLKGVFLCSQEGAKLILKTSGKGKIINIASLGGLQAWKEHIHYSASKAGVLSLTRSFARTLAPDITVNAIAPGTIIIEGEENPEIKHIDENKIPLKRYGEPIDITEVVLFLSTGASYITGVTIPVDGGRSIDTRLS